MTIARVPRIIWSYQFAGIYEIIFPSDLRCLRPITGIVS